jgi:signal transduction histidine kinase
MTLKNKKLLGGFNRNRLWITLVVAVLLPAIGLIYVNFSQLRTFDRDKLIEKAIHRDFQEMLAISEKRINKEMYAKADDVKEEFPSADAPKEEIEQKLDSILAKCSTFTHVFVYNGEEIIFRTQPSLLGDKYVHEEHDMAAETYKGWFKMEGRYLLESTLKKSHQTFFNSGPVKRSSGEAYMVTAVFPLPGANKHRILFGGASFDPYYLKKDFLPKMIDDVLAEKLAEQGGNPLAMIIYSAEMEGSEPKPIAVSNGWGEGKPEVSRKFENVFMGLSLGLKYQGTSVQQLGEQWVHRSFIILAILSVLTIGGLLLTKRIVSKEMALAKLKSDFVSNVSHELRTPLALIRLYAETLELGRINTQEKKHQYYRIIRKESERLTALINNILDFSRIEAGRKEYEFRETDIAELVRNTLDSYRYQVEQQGFALEENIEGNLPTVYVDREAIARALVNLVNNALKYSDQEKFLGVKLYKDKGSVKLEVVDHGIGIDRRDHGKIFEKFYRAGDPLVHNTKGSGLGLSLVQHITQAHGGDIEVESTPGRGSKFTLSLPLAAPVLQPSNSAALGMAS